MNHHTPTRIERTSRRNEIRKHNNIGPRIRFARRKLGLAFMQMARDTGIPHMNLRDREDGVRTLYYEEILVLATYFDDKWQRKFKKKENFPCYKINVPLLEITPQWIMFGGDKLVESLRSEIELLKDAYDRREIELLERQFALERKLEKK